MQELINKNFWSLAPDISIYIDLWPQLHRESLHVGSNPAADIWEHEKDGMQWTFFEEL